MKIGPVEIAGRLDKCSIDRSPIKNTQGENFDSLLFKVVEEEWNANAS